MNDFEVNAVSIERTKEYTTLPQEVIIDIYWKVYLFYY